jgi:hypothetical protein
MVKNGMKCAAVMWGGMFLVGLSLIGGAVYVAVHFLSKVW